MDDTMASSPQERRPTPPTGISEKAVELLPCPFCGSDPTINGLHAIYCTNDECIGPHTTAARWGDALIQWNARALTASAAASRGPDDAAIQRATERFANATRAAALTASPASTGPVGREQAGKALYDHEFGRGDCEFPAWDHESVRESTRERFRCRADAILSLLQSVAAPAVGRVLAPASASIEEKCAAFDAAMNDTVKRLREESARLSGRSLDRGCVDSGIAANLADAAADEIERLRTVAPAVQEWRTPEGWKLVPVEPTPDMVSAGMKHRELSRHMYVAADSYRAMLAASPSPPDPKNAGTA